MNTAELIVVILSVVLAFLTGLVIGFLAWIKERADKNDLVRGMNKLMIDLNKKFKE